jgi:hypothetical protein
MSAQSSLRLVEPPAPGRYTVNRLVTPEMARDLLERNLTNRKKKAVSIARYAKDMKAGRWLYAGDPIRVDVNGNLLDGQNRLSAVIESGMTIEFLFVHGLEPETRVVMDSGVPRSGGDNFHMNGEPYAALLASICKQAILYTDGRLDTARVFSVSSIEQQEFLAAAPELREAASVASKLTRHIGAPPSVVGLAFWILSETNFDGAAQFFSLLSTRTNLPPLSPILALDSRLRQLKTNRQKSTVKQQLILFIKAWNAWRTGRTLKVLMLPRTTDPVPKIAR